MWVHKMAMKLAVLLALSMVDEKADSLDFGSAESRAVTMVELTVGRKADSRVSSRVVY